MALGMGITNAVIFKLIAERFLDSGWCVRIGR